MPLNRLLRSVDDCRLSRLIRIDLTICELSRLCTTPDLLRDTLDFRWSLPVLPVIWMKSRIKVRHGAIDFQELVLSEISQ